MLSYCVSLILASGGAWSCVHMPVPSPAGWCGPRASQHSSYCELVLPPGSLLGGRLCVACARRGLEIGPCRQPSAGRFSCVAMRSPGVCFVVTRGMLPVAFQLKSPRQSSSRSQVFGMEASRRGAGRRGCALGLRRIKSSQVCQRMGDRSALDRPVHSFRAVPQVLVRRGSGGPLIYLGTCIT